MGSTITTDKRAYAFRSGEKVVYALFESSYEKNCYPHQSRWCCIALGEIHQVLRRVYGSVEAVVGGGLQGRNGWISPVNYLKGWMAELAAPYVLENHTLNIKYGGGFYDALQMVSDEDFGILSAEKVRAKLESAGVDTTPIDQAITCAKSNESLKIDLFSYADFIVALAQNGVLPWRLIPSIPAMTVRDESLGYKPGKAKPYAMFHRYVRLVRGREPSFNILLRQDVRTGVWLEESTGGPTWLNSLAFAEEFASPGSVVKGLPVHLAAQKAAPFASLETVLTVSRPPDSDGRWFRETYSAFANKVCNNSNDAVVPLHVFVTLKRCLEAAALSELGYLSRYISDVQIDDSRLMSEDDMKMELALQSTEA